MHRIGYWKKGEKRDWISPLISAFVQDHRWTKCQLYPLQGQLIHIIPQGQSFLSHLSIATCLIYPWPCHAWWSMLKLWHQFLSSRTASPSSYDNHVTKPVDMYLYRDAATCVNFGGFNAAGDLQPNGHWICNSHSFLHVKHFAMFSIMLGWCRWQFFLFYWASVSF